MKNFKRVNLIVYDSFGIGQDPTAKDYDDVGANTYLSIKKNKEDIKIPTLEKLGLNCLLPETSNNCEVNNYIAKAHEKSNAKESMAGHWEMMGIIVDKPFPTFTENGFPKELIDELEKAFGRKIIGNKAASGTDILNEFGEREIKTKGKEVIVYTSNDPVLQICGNEDVIGLDELYRMCKKAREICSSKPEWNVGRIIARPYIGKSKNKFERTSNRHDYAVPPISKTYLNYLQDSGVYVQGIGKIGDLFSMQGIDNNISTTSNLDGIRKHLELIKKPVDKKTFIFTNLVDFDAKWGHRRDIDGYTKGLEEVDPILKDILDNSTKDDLIIVTADHGNDPSFKGTDHTRELVPVLIYSKAFKKKGILEDFLSFGDIGATISNNYKIKPLPQNKSHLKDLK